MPVAEKRSLFVVNFITGLSDGLLLPFAACIIARPFFMQSSWQAIAVGVTVAVVGAIAFGLARYRGEKEEIHHHHPHLALAEAEEEIALMHTIGIDPGITEDMKAKMEEERALWLKEVQEHELGWEHYDASRAKRSGLQTAAGFLAGGIIISLLYVSLTGILGSQFKVIPLALLLFYGLGWYRGRLTGRPARRIGLYHLVAGLVMTATTLIITQLILAATGTGLALIDL